MEKFTYFLERASPPHELNQSLAAINHFSYCVTLIIFNSAERFAEHSAEIPGAESSRDFLTFSKSRTQIMVSQYLEKISEMKR